MSSGSGDFALYCPLHTQEVLKLFCETCDVLTCHSCLMVEHKEHRWGWVTAHRVLGWALDPALLPLGSQCVKILSLPTPVWGLEAGDFPLLPLWGFSGGLKGQDSAPFLYIILSSLGLAEKIHCGGSCLTGLLKRRRSPPQVILCFLL